MLHSIKTPTAQKKKKKKINRPIKITNNALDKHAFKKLDTEIAKTTADYRLNSKNLLRWS
jgi:hypothetical protein